LLVKNENLYTHTAIAFSHQKSKFMASNKSNSQPNPRPNPRPNPQPGNQNYVIAPNVNIVPGKTQSQLADDWWKYQQSIPQEDNISNHGNGDFAGVNQSGDVYFLAGSAFNNNTTTPETSSAINTTIIVPQGKALFFPIINAATVGNNIVSKPLYDDTSEGDRAFFKDTYDPSKVKIFNLTIDGKPALNLSQAKDYRQTTQDPNGFSFNAPENSLNAGTLYENTFLAKNYADGYYVGINPLPPGKHTISFQAEVSGNTQNITYTIDVKPVKEIKGDANNNNINGTASDDIIDAGAGNDLVYGGSGNDIIYGGAGKDRLYGDSGDDVVAGGLGDDKIYGGSGNDRLYGGSGNDEISADSGNDKIFAGNGSDTIDGSSGDDVIDAVAYSALVLPFSYLPDAATAFGTKIFNSGQGQKDIIRGGTGRDTFVLGSRVSNLPDNKTGSAYYVGGKDTDYALIQDFQLSNSGDKIQLFGRASDYSLQNVTLGTTSGVGIYAKDLTGANDLVAIVQLQGGLSSNLNLGNSSQFTFVS
jgi:Ca2+-binding RTX toxin-like protein